MIVDRPRRRAIWRIRPGVGWLERYSRPGITVPKLLNGRRSRAWSINSESTQASARPRAVFRSPLKIESIKVEVSPASRARLCRLLPAAGNLRHFMGQVRPSVLVQPGDDPCLIGLWAILAHFPFALQARDRQLEADDTVQHALNEIRRCV